MHMATIGYGFREFIVMVGIGNEIKGKAYIEEAVLTTVNYSEDVFANLKFIEKEAEKPLFRFLILLNSL